MSSQSLENIPSLPDKAEGALLSLSAGDAIGWPQELPKKCLGIKNATDTPVEFREWIRRSKNGSQPPFEEIIKAGSYSDDTQLTLAVARARTDYADGWWHAFTRIELPLWTLYQRGGGRATIRSAKQWVEGHPPWKAKHSRARRDYYNAGGNGVAMRVVPHAIYFAEDDNPQSLLDDVVKDGTATHGHPRALIGAKVYAYAAWLLLRKSTTLQFGELISTLLDSVHCWDQLPGASNGRPTWYENAEYKTGDTYQQVWDLTVEEMVGLLNKAQLGINEGALSDDYSTLRELGCYGREKGSGTVSAVAAIYLASRYANQPNEGILLAAFNQGTDTDTLASMVGGLLGALQGTVRLPNAWFKVQDANYIRNVASQLLLGPGGARNKPVYPFTDPMSVLDRLGVVDDSSSLEIADRTIEATRIPEPRCKSTGATTHAWKLTTEEGQTLYINKVSNKDL